MGFQLFSILAANAVKHYTEEIVSSFGRNCHLSGDMRKQIARDGTTKEFNAFRIGRK
jgi:hypothetical protein